MKVGIIGCGVIGSAVIEKVLSKYRKKLEVFVYDIDRDRLGYLLQEFPWLKLSNSISDIISKSDFVIESASVSCAQKLLPLVTKFKKDILIMSSGGLLGGENLLRDAKAKGVEVIIPSGAIGGLDAIRALSESNIRRIVLSSYKPVSVLKEAPYVKKYKIKLGNFRTEKLIFKGNVREAIKGFPQSINVAASLLLSAGIKDIEVKIYACRDLKVISHKIEVESDISDLVFKFKNYPSRENPKTSGLAIYSACQEVKQYLDKHLN